MPPKQARGAAYVAAERIASKINVPYTPVKLDEASRRRLAKNLRDPQFAAKVTRQAHVFARDLVRTALERKRGKSRPDPNKHAGKTLPHRPQPPRPPKGQQRPGQARCCQYRDAAGGFVPPQRAFSSSLFVPGPWLAIDESRRSA